MNAPGKLVGPAIPLILASAGVLCGLIFEKIVLGRLRKITEKTDWEGDDIIINAVKGITLLWFSAAGLYLAVLNMPMTQAYAEIAKKILMTAVMFSATMVLSRIAAGFVDLYSKKTAGALPATSLFANIAKITVYLLGILVILQSLGISIAPILTALGVGGLAVALALQDTLSNLFSGLSIAIARQIKPGDYVRLEDGSEGYVTDIAWRNTTIRSLSNNLVVVPNSKIATTLLTNFNCPEKELSVLLDVGVSYDSDLEKVQKTTIEVGREVMGEIEGGVPGFEPYIRYHTLGDYSINFSVILKGRDFESQYLLKHEFIKRLHRRYAAEGINIPFPVRTVHLEKARE